MRTLPEHAVECWLTAAIRQEFPAALVWAPTQVNSGNWDTAVKGGAHKYFLTENKGCEFKTSAGGSGTRHTIEINVGQLENWAGVGTKPAPPLPVYYVLPVPPWPALPPASPGSPMPVQATCSMPNSLPCSNCGTTHPNGFGDWAHVIEAADLLRGIKGLKAAPRHPTVLPVPLGKTFEANADAFASLPLSHLLTDFLREVRNCDHVDVVPAPEEDSATPFPAQSPESEEGILTSGRRRGLLAVHIQWTGAPGRPDESMVPPRRTAELS